MKGFLVTLKSIFILIIFSTHGLSANTISDENPFGWEEFIIGMPISDAKKLLEKRCMEIHEHFFLNGYYCGKFFNEEISIRIERKSKFLFFQGYIKDFALEFDNPDKENVIGMFEFLKNNYKNNNNYKKYYCEKLPCYWHFNNKKIQLAVRKSLFDQNQVSVNIDFGDVFEY